MIFFAVLFLVFALLPTGMVVVNLREFRRAPREDGSSGGTAPVSVIVPARDEESSIEAALTALMKSEQATLEVIVVDDHSTDRTAEIVQRLAVKDARIRYHAAPVLPEGWNGKQHACWVGANAARYDKLLFLDADVRMKSDGVARCLAQMEQSQMPLVSGFPFQETGTILEKLLIPMMHVLLLGYLPIQRMRQTSDPSFAAGCGQLFLADRSEYFLMEGHRSIHASRHDGIQLPKRYRRRGYFTDIFDASDIATCRMYHNAWQVWRGLSKNAHEGIANSKLIGIFTLLLGSAFVLPLPFAIVCEWVGCGVITNVIAWTAVTMGFLSRALLAQRFRQSWLGVFLHPVAVFLFLVIQWISLIRHSLGRTVRWRGRE